VERTGYADYWELLKRRALPKETSHYVPIILAMTIMAKNPQDYGLDSIEEDDPIEYDTIHLDASTNVALIADAAQQPVSVIRDLNPSLLSSIAPANYDVHVPKGAGDSTVAAIQEVPPANRNAWRLHHVADGETLEAIARQYHTPADRIVAVNDGADELDAGQTLLIPAVYHPPVAHARAKSHASGKSRGSSSASSRKTTRHTAKTEASSVSQRSLHRKAAVRTASVAH
jgi:membrane-bound lytic murein transglycosylase D